MRGFFITGTGTGVGKTYVAALIARELTSWGNRVGVYKPVASGCEVIEGQLVADDAVQLWEAIGRRGELEHVCPQCFEAPLAPPLAAQTEGKAVDSALLRDGIEYWQESSDIVLIEGAGGLMSPISDDDYNADLAADFGLPLLVVASNELGTINGTLQTLITAATYVDGLAIAGVVLNRSLPAAEDLSTASNLEELQKRCVPPILANVPYGGCFDRPVDWWALAEGDHGTR